MADIENVSIEHYDEDGNLIGTEIIVRLVDPSEKRSALLAAARVEVEAATTILGIRKALLGIIDALTRE